MACPVTPFLVWRLLYISLTVKFKLLGIMLAMKQVLAILRHRANPPGQWATCGAGVTSHYPQQALRSELAVARWQGSDNGGFDEVELGSPPLKPASAGSNGGPPHLEKVAHSLRAYSKAEGKPEDTAGREASQLRNENASLKQRLSAIENVRGQTGPHPRGTLMQSSRAQMDVDGHRA